MTSEAVFIYVLNALWQVPLFALVTGCSVWLLGAGPRVAHRLWVACLVLSVIVPASFFVHSSVAHRSAVISHALDAVQDAKILAVPQGALQHLGEAVTVPAASHVKWSVADWIALAYAATVLFALLRLLWSIWQTRRLLRCATSATLSPELQPWWDARCSELHLRVYVLSSREIAGPATASLFGPVLLLPEKAEEIGEAEMRAALRHELAHIERQDFRLNLLYEAMGSLLFFHPAMHFVSRRIQQTREMVCDAMASEGSTGPMYAQSLLELARMSAPASATHSRTLGVFEGDVLERRITALVETKKRQSHLRRTGSFALSIVLLASSCALVTAFAMQPLLAQSLVITDKPPAGWFLAGDKPTSYKTGVDHQVAYQKRPSAYLVSTVQDTGGFGTLMQSFNAAQYVGKRVRFRAAVKTKNVTNWAGLWLRVDQGEKSVGFDNMQNRPLKGSTGFQTYDVVLDVPQGATGIAMGVLLSGPGEIWINGLKFEVVGHDVPVTGFIQNMSPGPANLDFQR